MALPGAFQPVTTANAVFGNSIAVTIAASNTTAALPFSTNYGSSLRVFNASAVLIAITTGISAATAVAVFPTNGSPAAGYVVGPGEDMVITIPPNAAYVGVIGASASTALAYFTQGEGL